MSGQQLIFGLLEFLVSVLISFILIFGSYRIILVLTRRIDEEKQLKKKNISVGIVLGSIFIGEALVVKQAIYPVMAVIQLFILGQEGLSDENTWEVLRKCCCMASAMFCLPGYWPYSVFFSAFGCLTD